MQSGKQHLSKWPKFGIITVQTGRHCCLANEGGNLFAVDYDPFTAEVLAKSDPNLPDFAVLVFDCERDGLPEVVVEAPQPRIKSRARA